MMHPSRRASLPALSILALIVCLSACTEKSEGTTAPDTAARADAPTPATSSTSAPTAASLLDREQAAAEAFIRGDGRHFERVLDESFVKQKGGRRVSKSEYVGMIDGLACETVPGWTLSEPKLLEIDADAYVLSYASDSKSVCRSGGKAIDMPSPARVSTLWVRGADGDNDWKMAFQGRNKIIDLSEPQEAVESPTSTSDDSASAVAPITATHSAETTDEAITTALMAVETAIWDAWRKKDADRIVALTADEISFVDLFGLYTDNKSDTVTSWTSPACNVTDVALTDGVGTPVSPTIGVLTVTGTLVGECGGQDISGQIIRANTIYRREGNGWKWVFGFNSPV